MMPAANAVDAGNKKWTGSDEDQSIFILVSSRLKESSIPWPKRLTVHPAELFASRRNRSIHQIHDDVEGEHEDDNH